MATADEVLAEIVIRSHPRLPNTSGVESEIVIDREALAEILAPICELVRRSVLASLQRPTL